MTVGRTERFDIHREVLSKFLVMCAEVSTFGLSLVDTAMAEDRLHAYCMYYVSVFLSVNTPRE